MRFETDLPNGTMLRKIRAAIGLTAEDAGALMGVTVRMVTAWERGAPMPDSRLDLLKLKILQRRDGGEMVVVLRSLDGRTMVPVDVVTESNFVNIEHYPDDSALIRSMGTDPKTGEPFIHSTKFAVAENEHVMRVTHRWKREQYLPKDGLFDEAEMTAAKAIVSSLLHITKAAEARNPNLRVIKDQILEASRAIEGAPTAELQQEAQSRLDGLVVDLLSESHKNKIN